MIFLGSSEVTSSSKSSWRPERMGTLTYQSWSKWLPAYRYSSSSYPLGTSSQVAQCMSKHTDLTNASTCCVLPIYAPLQQGLIINYTQSKITNRKKTLFRSILYSNCNVWFWIYAVYLSNFLLKTFRKKLLDSGWQWGTTGNRNFRR